MKKLIIEVRMNETAEKAVNPNVAYTPGEIVSDAIACGEAGAAIVHFHARNADGSESNDAEHYRAAIRDIRAGSDVLIHTTLGLFQGATAEERLAHIERLVESGGVTPDIAPLDMGSNNIAFLDPDSRTIRPGSFVYKNETDDLILMARRLRGWGIKPQAVLWNIANARLLGAFIDADLIDEPGFAVCAVGSESFLPVHPDTPAGLRAYADNLPARRIEWSVLGIQTDMLRLAPEIIALGGHISIGLGDYAYAELGQPTNADLVRRLIGIAQAAGREVATPDEARAMLGIAQMADAAA